MVVYLHSSQANSFSGLSPEWHFSWWISLACVCKDLLHVLQIYCFPPFFPFTVRLCLMIEVATNFFLQISHSKTCANRSPVTGPVVLVVSVDIWLVCTFVPTLFTFVLSLQVINCRHLVASFVIIKCHLSNHFRAAFTTRIWRFVMLPGLVDVEKRFVCEAFATLIAEECGHLSFNVYYQLVWCEPIPPKSLTLYLQLCICSQFYNKVHCTVAKWDNGSFRVRSYELTFAY